ncbi:isoprenylcysteine carboxyl methyltransferase family protein [Sporomusa termitida]|uniref:Isoprenylcysteine carboxyl methyltransferase (ICMT) family protein n=1 Tax=Sporomusa termitida TaxID=2377 RepID=A0A517DY99_9FIRM|nr:isoprenylcysteine carboxylmethyltransferase family protein [Sporomusa termitida]QDR82331.1 Isoprenylcysteine carboxyl methyltransferase (ICMT) family protein [Sporomusa termitida]
MVAGAIASMAAIIAGQRLGELLLAQSNRRRALACGAREYGANHYRLFFILHGSWLAGWVLEGQAAGALSAVWPVWLSLFAGAQLLRYWCIISLGRCWNTRILVIPGQPYSRRGPYRYFRHPNYLAVAIELAAVPLLFGAVWTAAAATLCNAALLLFIRIPAEERALNHMENPR